MKLSEIFSYANMMADNEFSSLSTIIDWLNEGQEIVATIDPIEAPDLTLMIDSDGKLNLPEDLQKLVRVTVDDIPVRCLIWSGVATFDTAYASLEAVVRYYKTPATLLATTPDQVPDIKSKYHRALADYANGQYALKEDDPEVRSAYRDEFVNKITQLKASSGNSGGISQFYNY